MYQSNSWLVSFTACQPSLGYSIPKPIVVFNCKKLSSISFTGNHLKLIWIINVLKSQWINEVQRHLKYSRIVYLSHGWNPNK